MPAHKYDIEAPPVSPSTIQAIGNQFVRSRWQTAVCMQKKQCFAARHSSACVHLKGAAARRRNYLISERTCQCYGGILAAAVHDNNLRAARTQRRKRLQRIGDALSFVKTGDDYGNQVKMTVNSKAE